MSRSHALGLAPALILVALSAAPAAEAVPAPASSTPASTASTAPVPVAITVDATKGRRPISPALFGKNFVADQTPEFTREVGLKLIRESGGNNVSKLNWKADLSSHPDWYNNVYPQGVHKRATELSAKYQHLQVMFGVPALGFAAKAEAGDGRFNFTERDGKPWDPNAPKPNTNLAGGGDSTKYTVPWSAKDSVDMLDHWFSPKPGGLGLDKARFNYFHIDNEPECWSGTHDDVYPKSMSGEECVQKYVAVAKELRTRHPEVRILAPGFTAEWFWWNWSDNSTIPGTTWLEFFLKRMGEESAKFGKPLIDVVDFHAYIAGELSDADFLQQWRIFYDPTYICPSANGVKRYPDGGWHEDQKVENLFGRTEEMLDTYFPKGHGIGIGVTECSPENHPPMVTALWYASLLGTYADHGVEVLTPWTWKECWWEVLYLFSKRGQSIRVESTSSEADLVSAYSSINPVGDALTVILVNRDPTVARKATIHVSGFMPKPGGQEVLTLSNLGDTDLLTFKSASENALKRRTVSAAGPVLPVDLPPYSITAVELVR